MTVKLIRHHAVKPHPGTIKQRLHSLLRAVHCDSDLLRAHLHGAVIIFHWECFLAQMRDNTASE